MTCPYNSKLCCLAHFKEDGCTTLQHEAFTRQGERDGVPVSNSLGSSEEQWSMAPGFRLVRFASLASLIHPQTAEREKTGTVGSPQIGALLISILNKTESYLKVSGQNAR